MNWTVRAAQASDLEELTTIWADGWHFAHAAIVPAALTRLRTRESFRDRLRAELDAVRVVGESRGPIGFAMVRGAELYQFYVAAHARGSGAAAALMQDVEAHMAASGVRHAWLGCAVGNDRAARFYEKCGWRRAATVRVESETSEGPFALDVWKYEKALITCL